MVSVSFTGDISFSKHFTGAYERDFIHEDVVKFLSSSDHVVANVECAVTSGDINSDRTLNHATPPEAAVVLDKIGADVWTLANNHIMDCKEKGLVDTLETAKAHGARTIGVGRNFEEASKPVYFEGAGGIGVFSVTYDRPFLVCDDHKPGCVLLSETERIKAIIKEIKRKCRWCIMVCHGGGEFAQLPLPYIRKRYKQFLSYGADIVVGHHPHVVENYEFFGKKAIFYSLGNFIFDTNFQRNQRYTDCGMLLKLFFEEDKWTWENLPVKINRESQTIEPCENPVIFREVTAGQYALLWPLAVADFVRNDRSAKLFNHPEWESNPPKWWFNKFKGRHGRGAAINFRFGCFAAKLGLWKLGNKEIAEYIK